jgi:error-prone DNA polymerase
MFLNNHSYYSLRYGTMPVGKLVSEAVKYHVPAMALTDINTSMGIPDFVMACTKASVKPIAGIEFRNGNKLLYTCIAKNNKGMREINDYLSLHNELHLTFPEKAREFSDVFVIYPFFTDGLSLLNENEYMGVRFSELNLLYSLRSPVDQSKLIAWQPVSFSRDSDYTLHRHLRAIDRNILLTRLTEEDMASPDDHMMSPDLLRERYQGYPILFKNAERLTDECSIQIDFKTCKNKKTFTGSVYDDKLLLEKLAYDGFRYRYDKNNKPAFKRLMHELGVVDKLGFSSYFLIAWDIIRYSISRGFYHVGRGSGANSIVAYCLKITDVDPIELDLYFERFLNPKRTSPPDFDIDYSWKERDEVIDYIFKRYGKQHTALLGATSTFRDSSILRELGKVYGLPKAEIDQLVNHPDDPMNKNSITESIFDIGNMIIDFPNIRTIHAGGVLISEEPITSYTALDMPPKGFATTQWDMYVAEDLGFEKLDILSQRGIGHIKECVEIVKQNRNISIDAHNVNAFKADPAVRERLLNGECLGCFYIESPAMRGLLKKLRCDNYITLVAASSIIRPGVAKSGMMKEYIKRYHAPDNFQYLHPVMEEQLKETFGVMVYQEDVIKVCHHFAGLDLADADVLRRAMSGKFRSKEEFQRIVDKFFSNCQEKGYSEDLTKEVWRQIESFAGYSFSKAHSASYAVESYQSLFLKSHYPLEFMVAVINNFGGFYRTWVYVNEARRCGAVINLPCVNNSNYNTCIKGIDIYLGFVHISSLEASVAAFIAEERERGGDYKGLADFINRVPIGLEQLISLIRINAFRFSGKSKQELMWEAHLLLNKHDPPRVTGLLFAADVKEFNMPELKRSDLEDAYDEIDLLGFPVTLSWFDMLQTAFRGQVLAKDMLNCVGKKVKMLGNLVSLKYVHTVHHEWMHFGTFHDHSGEFFDTVNFPDSLKKYPYKGYGIYLVLGTVTEEFGFPSLTVEKMAKLPFQPDPRYK